MNLEYQSFDKIMKSYNNLKMKKYPYLLYISNDDHITNNCIVELNQAAELHILNPYLNNVDNIFHSNCYMYVFNKHQYQLSLDKNWKYHVALYGEDIFNEDLLSLAVETTEIFWFPSAHQLLQNIDIFIKRLSVINKPICINFNENLQKNIIPEDFRLFIKKIHYSFDNPVFVKELQLLDNNINNPEEYNFCLIQKGTHIFIQPIVLGLFGDYPIKNIEDYYLINKKKIFKTKDCAACDYNELCINRGIGYIMDQLQYQGCISIKLLQP